METLIYSVLHIGTLIIAIAAVGGIIGYSTACIVSITNSKLKTFKK